MGGCGWEGAGRRRLTSASASPWNRPGTRCAPCRRVVPRSAPRRHDKPAAATATASPQSHDGPRSAPPTRAPPSRLASIAGTSRRRPCVRGSSVPPRRASAPPRRRYPSRASTLDSGDGRGGSYAFEPVDGCGLGVHQTLQPTVELVCGGMGLTLPSSASNPYKIARDLPAAQSRER